MRKKAVWITGASSGIGKAIAVEFAKNKVIVIGSARRIRLLNKIQKELGEYENYFIPCKLDISDINELKKIYSSLAKNYQIDCLINNAGLTSFAYADKDKPKIIEKIIKTNLLGSIYTTQLVLKGMKRRKHGLIMNILSVAAKKIFLQSSIYSASKSGLLSYMNVLREEIREYNIRIINILPGATKTSIWPDNLLNQFSKKMMVPEDIAALVFSIYNSNTTAIPEEIILRPITGDL